MDWTPFEVDLIIEDYFAMFQKELKGLAYNKTLHRRNLLPKLEGRNEAAIEFKHQNISAVLVEMGYPYIAGYKPRVKRQQLLADKISDYLDKNRLFESEFDRFANQNIDTSITRVEFNEWLVQAPSPGIVNDLKVEYKKPYKQNYLEAEQRNQRIGQMGEHLVFDYEVWRLKSSGCQDLAKKVEWVSLKDDGAGFDILSKNVDGSDKYIEVKTTSLGGTTPIFCSKNENDFAAQHSSKFYMYRVFDLRKKPRVFIKTGSFGDFCRVESVNFKGFF